jgi:hypothetical protein
VTWPRLTTNVLVAALMFSLQIHPDLDASHGKVQEPLTVGLKLTSLISVGI